MENEKLPVSLTVAQWNVVMQALGELPFAKVASLIGEIKSQADARLEEKNALLEGLGGS